LDAKIEDLQTYADTDSLLMFVTNLGSFAYDATGLLSRSGGLHFPRGSGKTVVYAGGLWIGAKMGKGVRASAAEYDFDYVRVRCWEGHSSLINPASMSTRSTAGIRVRVTRIIAIGRLQMARPR